MMGSDKCWAKERIIRNGGALNPKSFTCKSKNFLGRNNPCVSPAAPETDVIY